MGCGNHPTSAEITEVVAAVLSNVVSIMGLYVASEKVSEPAAVGKFAEFVAIVKNPGTADLNLHHCNFPLYDSTSAVSVRSVKTHSEGTRSAIAARYTEDFRQVIGVREPEKFDKAAQSLFSGRNVLSVPRDIQRARSVEEVKSYLAKSAQLQVTKEHVQPVREALRGSVNRSPELYGLSRSEANTPTVVEALVQRVVPIEGTK
jgi:hypothetical protein